MKKWVSLVIVVLALLYVWQIGELLSFQMLTGLATGSGVTTITVASEVGITLNQASLDWGTGRVNRSLAACNTSGINLSTTGAGTNDNACWINISGGTSALVEGDDFIVNNTGNVNVSVTVNGSTASGFWGVSDSTGFMWRGVDDIMVGSCVSGMQDNWTNFSGSPQTVCDQLYWSTNSSIRVEVNLFAPANISASNRNVSVIFSAAES
ncbi:hypothetical protein CMO92_01245 [Candidatus Woesearchaeota archaeon]|nr:hypothetical protein [Candidatus Woesearchaeota archaeon]